MTHGGPKPVLVDESMGLYGEHIRMGIMESARSNDTEGNVRNMLCSHTRGSGFQAMSVSW